MSEILLSVLHPTARVRSSQAWRGGWHESMADWFANCHQPSRVEYILSVHQSRWNDFWTGELGPVTFPAWGRVLVVRNDGRDDNVTQVNAAAAASSGKLLVGSMDDLFSPVGWDSLLLAAVPNLDPEFVVHCSSGNPRDWEPLVNAGAITRARYLRFGYVLYPGYESMYADNEFSQVAYRDLVFIQRRDIEFRHRHWSLGQVPSDEVYAAQNRPEAYAAGKSLFLRRRAAGFPVDIPRRLEGEAELAARALPTPASPSFSPPSSPAVVPIRKSVALCFPGDTFSDIWNAHTFALFAQMVQEYAVFPPVWGYSSNVYTIRSSMLAKLLQSENKPDLVLWVDSDNLLSYEDFLTLAADLAENPEADMVAAWSWCRHANYRTDPKVSAGHFDRDSKARALTLADLQGAGRDLVPVGYSGFPAVLMRYSMLERVGAGAFAPIIHPGYAWGFSGEDVAFCRRAVDVGCKLFVDRRVRVPHLKRMIDDDEGLAAVQRKAVG